MGFAADVRPPDSGAGVRYYLDAGPMGRAEAAPYVMATGDLTTLVPGAHAVSAERDSGANEKAGYTPTTAEFLLDYAHPGADSDGNGLPDSPFVTLPDDNHTWYATVLSPDTMCPRAVAVARWEGAEDATGDVHVVLQDPGNPRGQVLASAPRALAEPGETGLLVVALAWDLDTLFGIDQARTAGPGPDGRLVAGGEYVVVSVLVSGDGGLTFSEPDVQRLEAKPLHLRMEGLAPDADLEPGFYGYPAFVGSAPDKGFYLTAGEGEWTRVHTVDSVHAGPGEGAMEADLTAAPAVFAPFESVMEQDADADDDSGDADDGSARASSFRDTFMRWLLSAGFVWPSDAEGTDTEDAGGGGAAQGGDGLATVWVDFDYTGPEEGTESKPFNTAQEGAQFVAVGGVIKFKGGDPAPQSQEFLRLDKEMTLEAQGGGIRIEGAGAPVAGFTASTQSGPASPDGLTVQFSNSSSGQGSPITACYWDFGDGATSGALHPSHTYTEVGVYTVSLTVYNAVGQDTETKTDHITVQATLTTAVSGTGTLQVAPSASAYNPDTEVTLTPTPGTDWEFSHWTGDLNGYANPGTVVMDADKSVTAVFLYKPSDLDITVLNTPPPSTAESGDTFNVEITVTNNGWPTSGWGSSWSDGVYLSRDGQLDGDDLLLNSAEYSSGLGQGQSYGSPLSIGVTVPDVSPGEYYFIVKTDIDDEIGEILEDQASNVVTSAVTIVDPEMNNV